MVACGGAHELPDLIGEHVCDRLGVLAPQRLAGQDDGAGIDVVGMDVRRRVSIVDDCAERALVDARLALVGRKRHRRLVERFARDDQVARRKVLAAATQRKPREQHLGSRGADVDADADQRDVVLLPDRIRLEIVRTVEMVMVVVVLALLVMRVQHVLAVLMVGDCMRRRLEFRFVGHRSSATLQILNCSIVSGANRSSGARRRFDSPCSWW